MAVSFCKSLFAEVIEILMSKEALLNGEEDPWFPVGDDLYEGLEGEFEKLKRDILEFNPFGELFHCYRMYFIEVNEVKYSGQ